jgi:Type I restriction modification DNA specificity domain/Peptidase family M20/M25/M40
VSAVDLLAPLEPSGIWRRFAELTEIPRPPKEEGHARAYVLGWASGLGLESAIDDDGNVVVRVPASSGREDAPTVVLQSHLDMVCEREPWSDLDPRVGRIRIELDDGWVVAPETTLGADNGIGVAAAMAVAEDASISHGPLELLFTVSEEQGLDGAKALDPKHVSGRLLLNLDGTSDHSLTIGCAGSTHTFSRLALGLGPVEGVALRIAVSGARGGHLLNSATFVAFANQNAEGIERPRLSWARMATFPTVLPPLNEQRRIVAAIEEHLSRLDAGDSSVAATQTRFRALRSSLLDQAFRLDAPRVSVGSVAKVGSGATPKRGRSEYWDDGTIPWVTSGQLSNGFVREPAAYITERALKETNVKLWPAGTLLIALYGEGQTRGRCAELAIDATTNQACAAVLFDESAVDRTYARYFFDARYEENRRLASGGVQPNLSVGLVRTRTMPLPPLDEQRRIVAEVEARLSALDALRASIERAQRRSRALRAAVLAKAFRGELVPQDPTEEPADALLARIRAELDS